MGAVARLKSIFDNETWYDIALPEVAADPLKFRDERKYADRIKDARSRTGLNDAIKVGYGKLEGAAVVIAVQDFDFMGGSLGMAAGEAIVRGLELAVEKKSPFIVFAASGRARDRADHPREIAGRVPARRIFARSWHGRHGRASPRLAVDTGAAVPSADQVARAGNRRETCAAGFRSRSCRFGSGHGAGRAARVNAPDATPSPLDGLIARLSALHPKRIDLGLE